MTDKAALLALADKIEVAHASEQRALLEAAWDAVMPEPVSERDERGTRPLGVLIHQVRHHQFTMMLHAEAYLDAALTLLPDMTGKEWSLDYALRDERFGPYQARFNKWLAKDDPEELSPQWIANGHSPALALTAAALRARAEECE